MVVVVVVEAKELYYMAIVVVVHYYNNSYVVDAVVQVRRYEEHRDDLDLFDDTVDIDDIDTDVDDWVTDRMMILVMAMMLKQLVNPPMETRIVRQQCYLDCY